jgi:two-component system chemotaxis response regulator CheY
VAVDFSRLKILIVEQGAPQAAALSTLLQGFGTGRVDTAADVAAAIGLLKAGRLYDLMLCAFNLGAINGLSLVKAVRRDNRLTNRYMPIIMIIGRTPPERHAMIRAAGVNDFLFRPVSGHLLYAAIQDTLGRSRAFVETRTYFGPDRRQQQQDGLKGRRRGDPALASSSQDEAWLL